MKDREKPTVGISDRVAERLKARHRRHPGDGLIFPNFCDEPDKHLLRIIKRVALRAGLNCGQCMGTHNRKRVAGRSPQHSEREVGESEGGEEEGGMELEAAGSNPRTAGMITKTNFKETVFQGTLFEVLEQGKLEFDGKAERLLDAHEWLRNQLLEKGNILPVRKFGQYASRGSLHPFGGNGSSFMPCDNEPLAHLYKCWACSDMSSTSIGQALRNGKISASWNCDAIPKPTPSMIFKGVKTQFRDRGLKLAHISDAGRVSTTLPIDDQIPLRFLRSLSPLNVFLFPSKKCCEYRLISNNDGWKPDTADWAEDTDLRRIALGWLLEWLGSAASKVLPDFGNPRIKPNPSWLRIAKETIIETKPKGEHSGIAPIRTVPRKVASKTSNSTIEPASSGACPKVSKSNAVTILQGIEILRHWRKCFPLATRLDGSDTRKSNPEHWLHIRVAGYGDNDNFRSRHGRLFRGQDYNGIVNFHGDTPSFAVDRFIELMEQVDNVHDVLLPSATHETTKTRNKKPKNVRPKFALKGYQDEVEGFFLYHDDW